MSKRNCVDCKEMYKGLVGIIINLLNENGQDLADNELEEDEKETIESVQKIIGDI